LQGILYVTGDRLANEDCVDLAQPPAAQSVNDRRFGPVLLPDCDDLGIVSDPKSDWGAGTSQPVHNISDASQDRHFMKPWAVAGGEPSLNWTEVSCQETQVNRADVGHGYCSS
jgi:hypothetical protein